ncbi:MAG: YggS family pyridoxal phosphate-dependent enzyme [Candidatus Cryptobacteroides sp.]|nr:YggS family pyridoxal phosphate-dependent enzyme [Rikenellaceae bacterium]MDY5746367.1 YggS family pyridoxal phosphate-dependent enzyme [Candidatus Cryptobacteroides sp.]
MISDNLNIIKEQLPPEVKLVAVSKFHPLEAIMEAYDAGQRCFAESRPQELKKKVEAVEAGKEIEWQFIGHLQTNKLKMVLPYVDLVQSVDSLHLLDAINGWGRENGKQVKVLLELHVAAEESKQGFVEEEVLDILFRAEKYRNIVFCGLMGMATNTDCEEDIRADFARISSFMDYLKDLFPELEDFRELSIGMSDDWKIALEYGATMVRIGTSIFGPREY